MSNSRITGRYSIRKFIITVAFAVIELNSNVENVGPDLHLSTLQSVVTQPVDVPLQQLSSPPKYPAPSLEHVLDQHQSKDQLKTIPAMYDLPENFSSKEV